MTVTLAPATLSPVAARVDGTSRADADQWGPRLYEYLEAVWRADGTNQNSWSLEHRIPAATISRLGSGAVPSLSTMRTIADALGLTLVDVQLVAGVLDEAEVKRKAPAAPAPQSIDDVIETDPTLQDWQRKAVSDVLTMVRGVESEIARGRRRRR